MWEVNEIIANFPECILRQPLGVFAYVSTNICNSDWNQIQMVAFGLLMDFALVLFPCCVILLVLLTISPLPG